MNGQSFSLTVVKHDQLPILDYEECDRDDDGGFHREEIPEDVTAALPKTTMRWRMVYMRSDFTYLNLIKICYSVKYTDIKPVITMARSNNVTLSLHSDSFKQGYASPNFGIYVTPHYQDRIFVGPYLREEIHGIEFYR